MRYICSDFVYTKSKTTKPPSPPSPPGLPLVGNLLFLDPELHTYFAELARKYGPIVKLRLGNKIGIVVTSPSTAHEVLMQHDINFANRDVPAVTKALSYGRYDIVWSSYGPEWRMLRKICVIKMLSNTTLDSVYGLRRREVREMVSYMYGRAGTAVDVGEQMFLTILNVVTNMSWGGTVQGIAKKMKGLSWKVEKMLDKVIDQRLEMDGESVENNNGKECKDFLQFLLRLKEEGDSKTPALNHDPCQSFAHGYGGGW
ncbi:hypothetical protein QYF36_019825 [Acer negundo]|nr:hypothetical protein QYF36_019825 [Acer negundo]